MSVNNLTVDGEFRYIVTWFNEFSELQRDDFVPVMVEYLTQEQQNCTIGSSIGATSYMNGVVNSMAQTVVNDKPMSLFQCRIKLFRQWTPKWPVEFKPKLTEKISEIDAKIGEKIIHEIKGLEHNAALTNGNATDRSLNEEDNNDNDENTHMEEIVNAAVEIVSTTEQAIHADNRLVAALINTPDETSVDDVDSEDVGTGNGNVGNALNAATITNALDNDNANAFTQQQQQQQQQHAVEPVELAHASTVVAATNAEVPLTA